MNLTPTTETATIGSARFETGGYIDGERATIEDGSLACLDLIADLLDNVTDHPDEITTPIRHETETLRFRLDNARGIEDMGDAYATVCEHLEESMSDAIAVLNDHTDGGSWGWESGSFVLTVGDACSWCSGLGCQSCAWTGVETSTPCDACSAPVATDGAQWWHIDPADDAGCSAQWITEGGAPVDHAV